MEDKKIVTPVQPYLTLDAEDYQEILNRRMGISSFYEFNVKNGNSGNFRAVPDGSTDLVFGIGEKDVKVLVGGTVLKAKDWEFDDGRYYFGARFLPGKCILPKSLSIKEVVNADVEIDRKIGRGEYAAVLETAAFNLENGQISPVTEYDGKYYIFQCVNDYDADATQERKTRLYETRKNQAFRQIYSSFQQENKVNFSDEMWSDIHFDANDQTETDNFFTLYQEKFGSQGF